MALTRPRYSQIPDTDWKQSVRVATTEDVGNVMLAAMPSTVDGVTLNFYDRVLLRSQANAAQNGIYYVKAVGTGANGIWERTKDASSGGALGAVTPSIVTQVEEGTINKNRTFKLTTTGNIELGTTDLSFGVQAAEPAGATGQLQFANVNNVIGGATTTSYDYVTGNLVLTGNVNTTLLYQNGKRVPQVFTSATPPTTPAVGDQWYQVGTDIVYEWLQDGATAYWIDISGATIANINPITGENVGSLVVNGGNESTSTNTGALQVVGGVGITGNLNVGGAVSFGGGQLGSDLVISSNTRSTSETIGAIRIASPGGLGVGGNIWAGGTFVANSRIPSTSISTGAIIVPGTGGLGVGGNIFVGQNLNVAGNITGGGVRQSISSGAPASPVVGDQWYQLGTDILYQYVSDGTGSYWVDVAGATVANISQQTNTVNDIHLVSGTPSTSSDSGALIVSGGVGIQGNLNLQGGFNITGGNLIANQNVTSTNTTTGSMVVTGQGGLGVGGNINVGGNLSVSQTASFLQNVIISANLVASGSYFAAGGLSVTNGNMVATGASAQIGGLTITNGAISGIASLGVTGATNIGGDLTVTGNISGGGVRKYAQTTKPTNAFPGDVWYKTDTDVYYTYVNDGTASYWIDYTSATVANITPQTNQTLSDIIIVSGTPSTNTTSGALQVQGGAGITGNVFVGNLSTATVAAGAFTYANGVSILEGNQGTYSNANVVAYLAASNISVGGSISASGNLTSSGSYFSAGGLSVTAGNVVASGARAVIGGLTIENGGISSLASLNVIGSGTLGGDFAITGNVTAGGLRKYAQVGAPANPVVGDVWYKTDTDVFYQYVNDGTNKYWIDYTSATVSNASPTSPQSLQDLQIVSGTPSTGFGTGALQVTGGAAVTGNLFSGNLSTTTVAATNFTYANGVSILRGNEGTYSNANVLSYLAANGITATTAGINTTGNLTASGPYLSAGGFTATAGNIRTTSANIGGVIIESGGIGQLASLGVVGGATIGGDLAITGNITGGGLRKYAQINAPANPVVGDVWYKTDTDVYYQYITDGTKNIWVDYSSATVSNANPTTSQSLQDLQIVSGTNSTSTSTGALVVQGGIGASGNVFVGNVSTATVSASNFTYANGVSILVGNEGTYSNANVTAYLTARSVTIADGNITATGGYLAAGGFIATAGNIRTTSANIGGVIIESGGISQLASLGVVGAATIGGDLAVTGNVTGGGLRKYAQTSAPANPVVGDVWYKTDTDVYYQYINDGTNKYWVDYAGATVSNASITSSQISYDIVVTTDTQSTSTTTGAVRVQGGIGLIGNIYTTGIADFGGNLTAGNIKANNNLQTNTLAVVQNATVGGTLNVTGAVATGNLTTGNITGYGFTTSAGNITATGQYFSAGGLSVTAGNITATGFSTTGGNVIATGSYAQIGGLTIQNGGFGSLASLGVTGAATFGANVDITGRVTGGGIRKTSSTTAPASPTIGDTWYKTDTDTLYQYINDGTSNYWIDISGATVANIAPQTNQTLNDIVIVSGTPSTGTGSGALQVQGGVGITGAVYIGGNASVANLTGTTVAASNFTYANGVSILAGNEGTYSNANVTAYLTAKTVAISDAGNITTSGTYFNTAGVSFLNGNITASGQKAVVGGLTIENGGISSLASLAVIGAGTVGGDFAITGNITAGGLRKYAQIGAPANPVVGDVWYKTDTDVFYQYVNDGTNKYWIDYTSATVSNASPTSPQSLQDLQIVSGTASTNTTSGALQVTGGAGISGNVNAGNVTTGTLTATTVNSSGVVVGTGFTYANGVSILVGNEGTYSNSNVTAYLTARTTTISDGFLSTAGMTVAAGNLKTASANIGGVIIESGGIGSLASLGVVGAATIGADLAVTGNITGGGLRKYAQINTPANPVVGDVWYKTDTDVYYTYINDGTNKYWVDYIGATVSNASITSSQIAYDIVITTDTPSTSTTTGAVRVQGGIGLIGNIFTTGIANFGGNLTAGNILSNNNLQTTTLQVTSDANVTGNLAVNRVTASGNITSAGQYFSAAGLSVTNGNITATGTTATIAGLTINNGAFADLTSLGVIGLATFGANVNVTENVNVTKDITASGNIMGGGLRKYAQIGAPANPVVGDVWYKTDTDVYYQYINDGTSKYWIDYSSATVSNASPTSLQSIQDLAVVGGTPSTSTSTGAITILGGVGLSGNINVGGAAAIAGNASVANLVSSGVVSGSGFTYANGVSILVGNEGTYSNSNVTAYLTARTTTISDGYLSTAGITVTAGNIFASSANIGGLIISAGGIGSLASLGVVGGATIGGDLAVTGNITGGGIRKTTSTSAPVNPVVGDQWYKTDTDTLYQYINDGTTRFWVDVAGATVSNARTSGDQIAYDIVVTTDTQSTSPTTGAVRVQGGIGLIGNIYTTGIVDIGGNLRAGNITANNNVQTNTLQVIGDTNVNKLTAVGNITSSGTYFSAAGISVTNGNIVTTGTTATIAGLVINNGALPSLPTLGVIGAATFGANVDVTGNVNVTGNIMGGGVRKYAQTTKPTNAVPGDVWYKTNTDVYYTYVNDGTSSYWIDYVGATVSNAAVDNSTNRDFTIASGTRSTDPTTGALVVVGGVGITGDINTTGDFTIDGTFTACTAVSAGYLNVADGIDSYGNVIIHGPGTANYTVQVRSSDAADNVLGIKTSVAGGGFAIDALNSELIGATPMGINANTFSIGIKNSVGTTVQADALKVDTAGNTSIAKTLSVGQHVNVTGNVSGSTASFTKVLATTANFTTLNLSGTLTVPTLNVTTTIDAPGIRKYAQTTAPASPAAGDVWYKTDSDVYYTYVNDGTNSYWIDYVGATVSNAAVSTSQSVDLRIASGTESTNTDTGALTVVGGIGLTGNLNANYIRGTGIISDNFSFANGRALAATITGTYSNTNVAGYLSGSITAGSINVTGTLTAPGIRKTTSISAPTSPVVGDLWYKTDTDVYYQYINDGTNNVWVDYVGATVSNAAVTAGAATDYAFTSGTPSTSTGTGAVVVSGGVGISGDLFTGGFANFGGNVTVNNLNANVNVQTNTLAVSGSGAVAGNLTTGNLATGIATIARADIAGALVVGGDVTVTGNITGGGIRRSQSTTPPANPTVGDLWYKTDTDVYYQYTSDGVNKYWIDYVGATVSNAAVQNSVNYDFRIASGTASTNTDTGALTIVGGVGITGNINSGSVISTGFYSDNFSFANGRTLADRITGTFSNTNVAAYLTGSITTGNITAGNIATTDITSRDITARNVTLSGNITGGGLRKYAQAGAPANPILGDVWYKTDTDVYYQYINDGANYFWVDYVGPTVSNAAVQNGTNSDFAIASGTLGTSPVTGALVVTGGVGVTGNIYTTGIADFGGNLRAGNVTANNNVQTNTLAVVQNATVSGTLTVTGAVATGNLATGNITGYGFTTNAGNLTATGAYLSAGGISATSGVLSVGNIISSGTRAVVGGLTIENGAFGSVASLAVIAGATFGGDVAITGNITAGGLRKYAQINAPTNPVVGDVWYKTDTDVYYQYINDGTSKYWVDYTSATVSNASPTSLQSVADLAVVGGTPSTSTSTGAMTVIGGVGISGNVFTGNLSTSTVSASNFTYANGTSILAGNEGTYSNANVTAYLTARSVTIADGNITATGGYLAAGGFVATAGNIRTTSANIGGVIIESGGIGQLASIGVIGSATIGADLAVTGNITGGGLRKYAQDSAPTNPVTGDVWYKTDTDVYYQYINDGTTKFWVDYVGATVSNASITSSQISYDIVVTTDTQSTSTTTGAIRVQGGIGLIGNIYTTGIADFGGNLRAGNVTANNNLQTNTLAVVQNATVGGTLNVTGALSAATLSTGNVTVGNILGYGFTTNAGNLTATGAYFAAGGMTSTNGNITVGNINAYSFIVSNGNITSTGTYARVGGLEIVNGGFTNLTSLGVVGSATIGADLAVTGNITGGGLRKYTGATAPANPVTGDVWYKTDTDVYYQYITDGTSSFWVDYTSATVANITLANAQYGTDVGFVSGTLSTSQTTGAVTVIGGVGITGNINLTGRVTALDTVTGQRIVSNTSITGATLTVTGDTAVGNLTAGNITSYGFTTNNGNVTATGQLTVGGLAQVPGNLTATGSYFSAGGLSSIAGNVTGTGFSITAGNIITTGQKAVVGGLTIENGALPSLPSIGIIGSATIGADLAVTGNITGGGLRKYAQINTPTNPILGDVWYKTDTDVYYQYITDGTTNVWVDYTSATVANITLANAQYGTDVGFVSGTLSTNQTNGAVTVIGGVGVTGNINLTGRVTALDTITGQRIVSNTSITGTTLTGTTLSVAGDSSVGNLTAGNVTGYGFTTNNGNVTATGNITGYGFATSNGNLSASGAYFSAGGMTSTNGNITVGNINAYSFIVSNGNITSTGTYARIGGLEIINGGFANLASLGVVGSATIGADLAVTGNITGGGLRKTQSTTAPANPVQGDVWYKTDTDVYYQYINDGTASYWIDYVSATVANITQNAATVSDLQIVSGTPSTSTSTGALTVAGGVGITGDVNISSNVNVGNVNASIVYTPTVRATSYTYPNGASILDGYYFGTYSNANVGGYLTAQGIGTAGGNLTATGTYFSAGGLTSIAGVMSATSLATTGNIVSQGTYAKVGGLEIVNGGFGSLASIGVIGGATIGGDVAITGNITAGGLRKYAQSGAPANPIVGDVWYKTDTDVYYQYINDGTTNVWVDFVSATVANITAANAQYGTDVAFVSGTLSTTPQNGAVQVIGGVGVTGSINLTGQLTAQGTITGQTIVSNGTIFATTIIGYGSASFRDITAGDVAIGNINSIGFTTNNGNVVAGGNLTAYGLSVQKGNLVANGAYFSAGGLSSTSGAITGTGFSIVGGNVITTGQKAVIGGLTIENGAFGSVASLGVIGSATIGADLAVTGNITGGGLRKYAQTSTPANPIVGDVWYKTDADIYYTYVNDGTSTYWIDYTSAAIANITVANSQYGSDVGFVSGTTSTNQTNGAVVVIGGVGVTGNINLTGQVTALDTITAQAIVSNTSIAGATLSIAGDTAVGNLTTGSITATGNVTTTGKLTVGGLSVVPGNLSATGTYLSVSGFTALNGNITATGTTATIGGLTIANGGFGSVASLAVIGAATVGGDVAITGNITAGGIRKTTSLTAPANPTVGDQWYKTDTDILYQFMDDGTTKYWVDFASATVANITSNFDGLGDFTTIGNVIGNGIVSDNYYYANGVSFVTTTVANTQNIVANITNGFDLGLNLTKTGVTAGNYGSATSIPTIVTDDYGRITSITSNAVSTTYGLQGNVGTGSISGGDTLVIVGTPNQISTTVSGNTINIGFTPNITFTDFTVSGNLIYQGGGIKTTTSPAPPTGPTNGDMWYQSGTDILYRYVNDGTNEYWLDLFSTPLRAILPSRDIGGGDGEVQFNDNGTFGANAHFKFDKTTGTLQVDRFRITQSQSPATTTSPGNTGEITWDGNWMYVCVAPNSWVRAGLYTW